MASVIPIHDALIKHVFRTTTSHFILQLPTTRTTYCVVLLVYEVRKIHCTVVQVVIITTILIERTVRRCHDDDDHEEHYY